MNKNTILTAEDIIDEITKFANVCGTDLSTSIIWGEYKEHVRTILTDPISDKQQTALKELTFGLLAATQNGNDRKILSSAISTLHRAMIALRNSAISTEDVTVKFPEADKDRYIQLFNAVEGIRKPFSHEDIHLTYNNKDGSKLKISTDIGTVVWTKANGEKCMNTNLPDNKIRLCIKYFICGLYQPLEKLEWFKENTK